MSFSFVVILVGTLVAGFIQGLSGFGFSLVAMSFWAWVIDPKLAAVLAVFGGLTGQIVAAITIRRPINHTQLFPFIIGGLLGIPLGIWLLPKLDAHLFKLFIGALLAIWCPIMLASKWLPSRSINSPWLNAAVGTVGGVMGGLGGFTGVIPTLWCTVCGFDRATQREVIQNFNLSMLFFTLGGYVISGLVTTEALYYFLWVGPALLIPSFIGTRVYLGISDLRFRQLVLSVLTVSGIALLTSAFQDLAA